MKLLNILLVLISLILINSAVSAESQLPESSLYEQSCYEFEGQVLPRPKPCDYYQSAEEQVKEALIIASFEEYVENKEESLAKDYRATKLKLLNLAYEDLLSYLTVEQTQPPSRSDSCAEKNINEGSRFQKIAERKKTGTSPSNEEIKKNKIKLVNDLIGSQRVLNRLETKIRELSGKQSEYNHDIRSGSCDITQTEGSSFLSGPDNLDRGIYSCKATRSGSQERCTSNCEELNSIEKSIRTLEKSRFEVLTNYPILSMSEWKSKLKSNSQLAMATSLSGEYDLNMTAEDAEQILNDSLLRIQKNLLYTHSRVCNEGQNGIQDIIYNDKLIDELLKLHPEYARTYCESYREAERLKALKNYALAGASVVAVAGGITAPLVPAFAGSALAIGGAMTATDIAIAYSDVDSALKSESTLHSLVHGNESLENYRRVSEKNKQAILSGSMAALSSVGEVAGLVGSAVKTGARGAKAGVEGASETAELAGKIERVATRLEMNTDDYIKFVTKNANLSDAERKASILAKYPELAKDTNSVKMLDAVIEAHNHGKGSVFNYSPEVIAEKRAILKKAGWKDDQIQWMFDTGHAGNGSSGSLLDDIINRTNELRRIPKSNHNKDTLNRIGFVDNSDGIFIHEKSGIRIVEPLPGELPANAAGGFTHRQNIHGRTKILNPQWIEDGDVDTIYRNIDGILRDDLKPVIAVDLSKVHDGLEGTVRHEAVHYLDSVTEAGKKRLAIHLGKADTDPRYFSEALAFDIYTEMRAYYASGHSGVVPVLNQLDEMLTSSPRLTQEQMRNLETNATGFIDPMFKAVSQYYRDPVTGVQIMPSFAQKQEAGKILAELIAKYGLITRMP